MNTASHIVKSHFFGSSRHPYGTLVICLLLAISPFSQISVFDSLWHHDRQRILQGLGLTIVVTLLLWRLAFQNQEQNTHTTKTGKVLAGFFILGFLSTLSSYSPSHALYECASFLLLLAASYHIACEVKAGKDAALNIILLASGIGCAFYLFHATLNYLAVIATGYQPEPKHLILGFDNYRFFNHVQTVSLPLLALLALRLDKRAAQFWFWCVVLSLWWTLLFVAAGRGTFVGLMVGLAATVIIRRRHAATWTGLMLATCIMGFAFYWVLYVFIPRLMNLQPFGLTQQVIQRTVADPTSARNPLWELSWRLISENPLLGSGPLHFAHYSQPFHHAAHPHNWVLQLASEWGLPALVLAIMAIAFAWRALLKTRLYIKESDTRNQTTLVAWITIGVAILVDGLVSGLIVMPTSQLIIALYLGCAAGWVGFLSPIRSDVTGLRLNNKKFALILLGFSLVLWLYWSALMPHLHELLSADESFSTEWHNNKFWPRVWIDGYF